MRSPNVTNYIMLGERCSIPRVPPALSESGSRWRRKTASGPRSHTSSAAEEVVGDAEFRQRSETAGEKGRESSTEASTYRDLAPANVVRGTQPGSALLVYGHLPPARLSLRPWFDEPELRDLAEGRTDGC
jgi:hypothetical protein